MNGIVEAILFPADVPANLVTPITFRQSTIIDLFKGTTPLVIIAVIALQNAWANPIAWTYFGIHGSYGLLWVGKRFFGFADHRFDGFKPWWSNLFTAFALTLYWMPIWLICTNETSAPIPVIGISVMLYGIGVAWHFPADCHKSVFLEFRSILKQGEQDQTQNQLQTKPPRSKTKQQQQQKQQISQVQNLLTTRHWSYSRNPNYFGELLIYFSFCLLAWHWIPMIWLAFMVFAYWLPSMRVKEKSLSRFGSEWQEYKSRTAFFIPFIW